MGAVIKDLGKVGGKPKVAGGDFQGGGAGSTYFRVRDVGA